MRSPPSGAAESLARITYCRWDIPVSVRSWWSRRRSSRAEAETIHGLADGAEHVAFVFGDLDPGGTPLVRLHSECLTGDVFGSARCDCGPQLREAVERISRAGGILVYLRQEGRGIGLYNK